MMELTDTLALRVPHSIKVALEKLAIATGRKKSSILLDWISERLELEQWQIKEIEIAIKDADAGLFASAEDVRKVKGKWQVKTI